MERIVEAIVDAMFLRIEVGIGSSLQHCEIRVKISFLTGAKVENVEGEILEKINQSINQSINQYIL